MMNFLVKLETIINNLLIRIGELIWKHVPSPLKNLGARISAWKIAIIAFFKNLPTLLKAMFLKCLSGVKSLLTTVDWKAIFIESYKKAVAFHEERSKGTFAKIKLILMVPFTMVEQWVSGLSGTQAVLVLTFTGASIVAVIGIGFSGQRLLKNHTEGDRAPASVEEMAYERPDYYKKQTKHFEITNFILPIYIPAVNEIRSVAIDITATMSNRNSKIFLEKHEFQLRDHLIVEVDPSVASFHLDEEGKEIIKKKIGKEINAYLQHHEIQGEVVELKITYALAN
jgi:flagellar basal body-associated protein FliL